MSSIIKHPKKDFLKMHKAGKLAAQVLDYINDFIEPNITCLLYTSDAADE